MTDTAVRLDLLPNQGHDFLDIVPAHIVAVAPRKQGSTVYMSGGLVLNSPVPPAVVIAMAFGDEATVTMTRKLTDEEAEELGGPLAPEPTPEE